MMNDEFFDHSSFSFTIEGVPSETLNIRRLACNNDGFTDHYNFHISCVSNIFHAPLLWINQRAVLSTNNNYRYGMISAIQCTGKLSDGFHYSITLSSLLHPLLLRSNQRIFLNKKLSEIISQIFTNAGFISSQFQLLLQTDPLINYRVQFRQSDYSFLQLLLQQYGLQFAWKQDATRATLIVSDQLSNFNQASVSIDLLLGTTVSQISTIGLPDNFKVSTHNSSLQAGQLVQVNNQSFRIVNIAHTVQQDIADLSAINKLRYRADLTLITPCTVITALSNLPNLTPLLTAKTETIGGAYPYIDEEGKYFTRLPFDTSQSRPTEASPPEYLIQPHGNGMHFPVHANTEMAVTHLYGDINQPILLGVLANPNTQTAVTVENSSQFIHRSFGGNQLLMDDFAQQQKIQLNNSQEQNLIRLDATASAPQILIQSQQGQINFSAKQNASITTQSSHYQTTQQNYQVVVNNQYQLNANNQLIQSGKSIALSAKNNITLQTASGDIAINAQQTNLTAQTIKLQGENVLLESNQNIIQFYAKQNLTFQSGNQFLLQSGGSSISANPSGLIFNTPTLSVNAQKILCPAPVPP